ncbi:hypothetical protein BaRGS_00005844 [Batillaria attramentaria]|uniref:THAP-type domain-containing protein n=1 Tax=Batillaria attramentaria TaxID=370345 RepID=A0ABD0LTE3_9CAEN
MADSVIRNEEPASKRRKKTGFSCCVADCTGKHSDGISLHKFPSESNARRQWIRFVQVCRADFGPAYGTPNNNSMICERHFTSDAYDLSYQLKQSLGIECKGKRLLEGAVPSIQKHSLSNGRSQPIQVNRSPSASASVITTMASTSATCTVTAATSRPTTSYLLPGVPKQRGGYAKRERQRILGDMMSTPERDDNQLPVDSLQEANADMTESTHVECHTQTEPEQMKVHKQNKQVQVHPGSGMHRRFCERHTGELCEEEDVEVDVSGELHDVWDDDYHPGTDPELSSDELSDIKRFNGSFVQILQQCLGQHCGKSRTWSSQPIIRFNLPAGNLLISTGILFSGGIPSKILQFMAHINMATISDDTFFDHQAAYLQPMVDAMRCRFLDHYINFKVQDGAPLVLGGDGRADSVGHSAKYGTYTTVDLRAMKVVDIQLVQSNEVGAARKWS